MRKLIGMFCLCCLFCLCFICAGCRTSRTNTKLGTALYIGVTPDYPPLIFKQNGKITGIEADLANELSQLLDVTVHFVELPWDGQIGALLDNKTDIIMSGMTITDARKIRIDFSTPWLRLGLMPLVRGRDADKYTTEEALFDGNAGIGVQKGSTADVFVNRRYKGVNSIAYLTPTDAPFYLINRKIDVFIHDGPAVIWMASENEATLEALPMALTSENIAWGIRKDDEGLRRAINAALARWRQDGTLQRILTKWMGTVVAPDNTP